MTKPLTRGYYCEGCGFFEEGDFEPLRSAADVCGDCGCGMNLHVKAKVVEDKDDEEPIDWVLDLPIKVTAALKRAGIETMGQLREAANTEPTDFNGTHLFDIRGIGLKSYEQIKDQLRRWEEANG